jgi:O-antigen/teichoic acid export membrane protein
MGAGNLRALGLKYWNNPKVKQILMLFSVNLVGIPIGVLTSIVLTHYLNANDYGNYQFLDGFFLFTITIFILGFFQAANRALVLNKDKDKAREYYGATLVILGGLFLLMSSALIIYCLLDRNLQQKGLFKVLLYSIPFGWAYLLINYFEVLFQADNRMNLLAISRLIPKVTLLIGAVFIYYFLQNTHLNKLAIAWGIYLGGMLVVSLYVLYKVRPSFNNLKANIAEIWKYNKTFGFHVYIGSVVGVGIAQLTGVVISYFGQNNSGVGFYALALALANPLQFIPNTIATTNYKEFALHDTIPRKLTQTTLLLTFSALVVLWVLVPYFIKIFYPSRFESVVFLNFVVSIGTALYGMADYYNRFLGAHGYGKLLRNTAFIVGILILVFNFTLIPYFGVKGAAYTRLLGGLSYFLCTFYYYKRTTSKHKLGLVNN